MRQTPTRPIPALMAIGALLAFLLLALFLLEQPAENPHAAGLDGDSPAAVAGS